MYSVEKMTALLRSAKELEKSYLPNTDNITVCISKGNSKIGRVMNVSLMPILSCGTNCGGCMSICYDIKACMQYKNTVLPARVRNTVLAKTNRDKFFADIDNAMSRRKKNKFFRWHVAGDILDIDYLSRMIDNARRHPDFTIWTYTKQYAIVNAYCEKYGKDSIPSNFTIMFSEWRGIELDNPYGFPIFSVQFKDESDAEFAAIHPDVKHTCPGNCDICKQNHSGCIVGQSTKAHEH